MRWLTLVTLCMSMFIIVVDTTVMNVSISALVVDLNTSVGGIQAAIALYALVMASFMLVGGKLADIIGKKRVFLIGVVVFGVGTFIASISQSLMMLIIGWSVIEGLGSALMMPNIQNILRSNYAGKDRAFAYGIISAVAAVGAAVGPIVGGFLTTYHSWRWAFRLEVLIVILVIVLCRYIAKDEKKTVKASFDYVGALLSVFGWTFIVLGVLLGQTYGFWFAKQPVTFGSVQFTPLGLSIVPFLVCVGIILVTLLFNWQSNQEANGAPGLFKASLLKTDGLAAGFAVRFVQMAVTAAFLFTMPLLFQLTFEFSAMATGRALIPFSLALLVFAILGARLSGRYSAKAIIQVGYLIVIAGLVLIATTVRADAGPDDLNQGAVFGAGLGLIASQILNLVLSSVSAKDTAEVSGLNGTFEQLGNAVGVALVGTMMITGLYSSIDRTIQSSDILSPEQKVIASNTVEKSIQLVSDTQVENALISAGAGQPATDTVITQYSEARVRSFRIGIWFLVFLALLGLIFTLRLPNRKMVGN